MLESIPVERYQAIVGSAIRRKLSAFNLPLYDTHRYHFGLDQAGPELSGKSLRPILVFLACEAAGGPAERATSVALAIEMIHNFSLIHDDIEDNDRYRRSRLTVWAKWGKAQAIMSGNAMLKLADLTVADMLQDGVQLAAALQIHHRMTESCLRMIEGQHTDIVSEGVLNVREEHYFEMADSKTGALITVALACGVLASSVPVSQRTSQGFTALGNCLGRMFQIRDDVLGIWAGLGSGKPVGADIRRKKNALPMVHLLHLSDRSVSAQAMELFSKPVMDAAAVKGIMELMATAGTQEWCQQQCLGYRNKAYAIIDRLEVEGLTKKRLRALSDYLLERGK